MNEFILFDLLFCSHFGSQVFLLYEIGVDDEYMKVSLSMKNVDSSLALTDVFYSRAHKPSILQRCRGAGSFSDCGPAAGRTITWVQYQSQPPAIHPTFPTASSVVSIRVIGSTPQPDQRIALSGGSKYGVVTWRRGSLTTDPLDLFTSQNCK